MSAAPNTAREQGAGKIAVALTPDQIETIAANFCSIFHCDGIGHEEMTVTETADAWEAERASFLENTAAERGWKQEDVNDEAEYRDACVEILRTLAAAEGKGAA